MDIIFRDLQEIFFVLYAPFILFVILPFFVGGSILLAFLMVTARFWRPTQKVRAMIVKNDEWRSAYRKKDEF